MYSRSLEEIKEIFKDYSDGYRAVLLVFRNKEGGTNRRAQHTDLKKFITINSEDFFFAINKLQAEYAADYRPLRIYASLNSRDIEKAIHKFKQEQLDCDYGMGLIRENFYLNIKNNWISCLMKKPCKAQSNFLIDLDGCDDQGFHSIYNRIKKRTNIQTYYQTKNGYHIITDPFDYTKLECLDEVDVHPDALMLIDY